jgi:hypothetical protein
MQKAIGVPDKVFSHSPSYCRRKERVEKRASKNRIVAVIRKICGMDTAG